MERKSHRKMRETLPICKPTFLTFRSFTDVKTRLTDQIEFANVILLNKTDMVSKEHVAKVEGLVKTLNP